MKYPLTFYVNSLPPNVGGCANGEITHALLKEYVHYDSNTGVFTRLKKSGKGAVGARMDGDKGDGYRRVRLLGQRYSAHRLAWFYVHGEWPKGEIDHINHDPSDNRMSNLRDCTKSTNQQNRIRANRNSKTGYMGVFKNKNRFGSRIYLGKEDLFLGNFATAEQAHDAYVNAKREHHIGCTL
jgi:hypothetical protein